MNYTEHYDNMEQRTLICKDYESRGLRMLHDTFDKDWKLGDEPHGTLTFTDEHPPAEPEPELVRDLAAEIDNLKVRVEKLEKK